MKTLAVAALAFAFALPLLAQTQDPADPPEAPEPTPAPEAPATPPSPPEKPESSIPHRWFFGGGVGASFGTVDYFEVAPLIGVRVVPRLDLGVQPFYRWTKDGRYSPSVSMTDYGASLFARVRVVANFFVEADYQYTSYEYPTTVGGATRYTNNAFLAGAGYMIPMARNVGFYFSALYDFSYDSNDPYRPYDSPFRLQVGASVAF